MKKFFEIIIKSDIYIHISLILMLTMIANCLMNKDYSALCGWIMALTYLINLLIIQAKLSWCRNVLMKLMPLAKMMMMMSDNGSFQWAISKLKIGKQVRRKSFGSKDSYIIMEEDRDVFRLSLYDNGKLEVEDVIFSHEDVNADDWEVYE